MNIRLLKNVDACIGKLLVRLWLRRGKQECLIPSGSSRVAVIRPGGIGDAVLLIPILLQLRESYPKAEIHIVAEKRNAAAFKLCPVVDKTFCYDKPKDVFTVLRNVYDVVVDTEQWHRLSAVFARLMRARCVVGFATNERSRLLDFGVDYSHDRYEVESFEQLFAPLGVSLKAGSSIFLSLPESAFQKGLRLLSGRGNVVVIFPGASIEERRWPIERFSAVASDLERHGWFPVVVGGEGDEMAGQSISEASGALNLCGKTSLSETAAIIKGARLLISGDSGVLHIGVGLGVPTVSLFGPGIVKKWAPQGRCHVVLNAGLECSPCTRFGYTPRCSIGVECMKRITVEEVVTSAMELLENREVSQ